MMESGTPSSVSKWRSEPSRRNCETPLGIVVGGRVSSALVLMGFASASFTCQPPFENHGGSSTIDVFFPDAPFALAACALCFQPLVRLQRRPALVDTFHGNGEAAFQLGGEAARVVREGP